MIRYTFAVKDYLYSKQFFFQTEFGLKIPDWAKEAYPTIKDLAILDYVTSTATTLQKRLSSGKIFTDYLKMRNHYKYIKL